MGKADRSATLRTLGVNASTGSAQSNTAEIRRVYRWQERYPELCRDLPACAEDKRVKLLSGYSCRGALALVVLVATSLLSGCQPSPEVNVLGYLLADRLGTIRPADPDGPVGSLTGLVLHDETPIAGASVVVAERTGRPHTAKTDAAGRYRIDGIPADHYVPAAIAPGYREAAAVDLWGQPRLAEITADRVTEAPPLRLTPSVNFPQASEPAETFSLRLTHAYTATAPFPANAEAQVEAYAFEREGVVIDSLRVYRPLGWGRAAEMLDEQMSQEPLDLLLFIYPSAVDGWEPVSVAYASEGYGVVALSPSPAWGVDIDQHALDAAIALQLARNGDLGAPFSSHPAVALGGSFSSAIVNRLLRGSDGSIGAWVTVGGIGNAFAGAHDFYTGAIQLPPQYELVIPALGNPQIYPLPLLRFSPIFTASELPPTLIVHTAADEVLPLSQAIDLATAARAGGVAVETYFYDDVSHYLAIDENMTAEGKAVYNAVLAFIAAQMKLN